MILLLGFKIGIKIEAMGRFITDSQTLAILQLSV